MYVVGCLLGSDPCTCMYLLKRVMGEGGAFTVYCTYVHVFRIHGIVTFCI